MELDLRLNMSKLVVHVSRTPLAGAPSRLNDKLNEYSDYDSLCFIESDYKGNQSYLFRGTSIYLNGSRKSLEWKLFEEALKNSSILHIHNMISQDLANYLRENFPNIRTVYHAHSPLREGPLYVSRAAQMQRRIDRVITVAQAHPRFYKDATPVPNISTPMDFKIPRPPYARVRVMYSPVQARGGRWNGKGCEELDRALRELEYDENVEIIALTAPVPSTVLNEMRCVSDISIDEVTTGGFHQISLEGLQCGNAVINGADFFSLRAIMGWTGKKPPFVISTPRTVRENLRSLILNSDYLIDVKSQSLEYARKYLSPDRLVQIYEKVYDEVLTS